LAPYQTEHLGSRAKDDHSQIIQLLQRLNYGVQISQATLDFTCPR
jgi:hypothetical protein